MKIIVKIICIGILLNIVYAQAITPLTLEYALEIAQKPDFAAKKQQLKIRDEQLSYEALIPYDFKVNIDAQIASLEEYDRRLNDNKFYLQFNKKLFSDNSNIALLGKQNNIDIEKIRLRQILLEQKIAMLRAFFAVIITDLEYDYQTQKLALSAVKQTHTQEDMTIGYASEVEILKAKAKTSADFNQRLITENKQLSTRAKLADLLHLAYANRPDELAYPKLEKYFAYDIKDLDYWQEIMGKTNPLLLILNQSIIHLKAQKVLYENNKQIDVDAYLRLGEQDYQRDKNGNYRFGIQVNIPLYDPSNQKKISAIDLQITQQQLELADYEKQLNDDVLSLFLHLKQLKNNKKALQEKQQYLDFYLAKSSLEYEMRLTRNIGDAMVLWTFNELQMAKNDFAIALELEQLNLLAAGEIL